MSGLPPLSVVRGRFFFQKREIMGKELKRYYTFNELCDLAGLPPHTVQNLIHRRGLRLPVIRFSKNGPRRFPADEIEEVVATLKEAAATPEKPGAKPKDSRRFSLDVCAAILNISRVSLTARIRARHLEKYLICPGTRARYVPIDRLLEFLKLAE